ncbi:MAG: ATP-dependent Clp protease ATP-binding subunit [Acidobacteriia bacterium]|nr:ATP-dependent Clp protease ATP-binding subunit [Terriglobia bacterium]
MARLNKQLDPTQTGFEAEKLDTDLRKRIVGQDDAIQQIINIYQTHLAGMSSPGRPIGNLLFLGPTGSGKTRLVEATAESLVGDARAVIKIDCAEFQHSHEIAKLIGSPPGYLGHRETHPLLSQEVLNQYHTERMKISFVLFDEIEKASDALWNLLLGILDKATLTLGDNRRVDFSHALIFMTSNLGAAEMGNLLRPNLGFAAGEANRRQANGTVDGRLNDKVNRAGVEAARRKFTPEFMNRIDKTVVFHPLGQAELRKILGIELNLVQQRVFNSSNGALFVFSLTDPAKEFLLAEGTDMKYGARHLKRAIDRLLVHPLSNLIATGQVRGGDVIRVDFDSILSRLTFFKEAEDMPAYAMVQMVDTSIAPPPSNFSAGAVAEMPRAVNARSSRH